MRQRDKVLLYLSFITAAFSLLITGYLGMAVFLTYAFYPHTMFILASILTIFMLNALYWLGHLIVHLIWNRSWRSKKEWIK